MVAEQYISRNVQLPASQVRIHYLASLPLPQDTKPKGTVLLLHGFPQTSHQYRHVIPILSAAGYRVIAPDYRGAGLSSKPGGPFTKTVMAADIFELVRTELGITERIHLVGHDIGGMVAHAYASRYSEHVASITWGECPLPGTSSYYDDMGTVRQFHFIFHAVDDLPEALVTGRERIYLKHFFGKLAFNTAAFSAADVDHYVEAYSQPGALRCGFATYAAFETDAAENKQWLNEHGKCTVPALMASGDKSSHAAVAEQMGMEMYANVQVVEVKDSGHYIAEEAPDEFAAAVLQFIGRHV